MLNKLTFTTILIALGIITSSISHALPNDANRPIKIVADKATFSERNGLTTYSGNVVITQGTLKITADHLSVTLSNNHRITSIQATGQPATFQQLVKPDKGMAEGRARKIEYDAVTGIISLTGNATLTQAGVNFSGYAIRYSLKLGDVEMKSGNGQRVELVFPPNPTTNHQAVRP